MFRLRVFAIVLTIFASTLAQNGMHMSSRNPLPPGCWPLEKSQSIIDKTQTIRLAPELSQLTAGERNAVAKLLEVGKIFQQLYEEQRHFQALAAYRELLRVDKQTAASPATQNLLILYRLNQGPIATTLENKREPFLPVEPILPGKNVYPWGVTQKHLDVFMSAHPERREEILDQRTVVRVVLPANVQRDLAVLR